MNKFLLFLKLIKKITTNLEAILNPNPNPEPIPKFLLNPDSDPEPKVKCQSRSHKVAGLFMF
jgi:hypothetical protein